MYIGSHISIAKGFKKAAEDTLSIGGNTFQFFTQEVPCACTNWKNNYTFQ